MHVGFFTDSYLPRRSGVVRAVEAAGLHLRRRGHRVSVIAPAYPGYVDEDPDVHRVPSVAAPGHPDFPLAVPHSASQLRGMRELGLDVVHTHSPFLLGGVGLWVARTLHLPSVFTYHTLYAEYAHYAPLVGDLTRPLVTAYTTAYCNRCDLVLASVPSLARLLGRYGVRARIAIIPSVGIEPGTFTGPLPAGVRAGLGVPDDVRLLVFVGRLAKEKSLPLLMDAYATVPADTRLLFVGDGPERTALVEQARRLGISSRVIFAGSQPFARVVEVLRTADLFVFPSQTETLGLAVVEAMAAGLAVVAVRAGAAADIVRDGDTGCLVSADPVPFADAVCTLLQNPGRRAEMGRRGRAAAAASYSETQIVDRLIGLYETLIAERAPAASRDVN
ncbi:MAG TPA: glycosyltransferase [bacterium]|nr:glycosyltransferase [bacterium]